LRQSLQLGLDLVGRLVEPIDRVGDATEPPTSRPQAEYCDAD
jgi:hypothetical protein